MLGLRFSPLRAHFFNIQQRCTSLFPSEFWSQFHVSAPPFPFASQTASLPLDSLSALPHINSHSDPLKQKNKRANSKRHPKSRNIFIFTQGISAGNEPKEAHCVCADLWK